MEEELDYQTANDQAVLAPGGETPEERFRLVGELLVPDLPGLLAGADGPRRNQETGEELEDLPAGENPFQYSAGERTRVLPVLADDLLDPASGDQGGEPEILGDRSLGNLEEILAPDPDRLPGLFLGSHVRRASGGARGARSDGSRRPRGFSP